jgi:hypothetical protein
MLHAHPTLWRREPTTEAADAWTFRRHQASIHSRQLVHHVA